MTDDTDRSDVHGHDPAATGPTGPEFPRWLKWGLLGALAVLIVGYGLVFLYAKVINDSPDELDSADRAAALDQEPAASGDDAGGVWTVTPASELGYRVTEVLFGVDTEGVGRTDQISGTMIIDATTVVEASFTVDVATIASDDSRRDGQFRGRIMSTDEFPQATFVLAEPIELGTEPVEGASVEVQATGDLTLRGVTNRVTFDISAEVTNGRIGVLGDIPVVFADYGIANPSFGGVTTEDDGLLEFVLVFEPA